MPYHCKSACSALLSLVDRTLGRVAKTTRALFVLGGVIILIIEPTGVSTIAVAQANDVPSARGNNGERSPRDGRAARNPVAGKPVAARKSAKPAAANVAKSSPRPRILPVPVRPAKLARQPAGKARTMLAGNSPAKGVTDAASRGRAKPAALPVRSRSNGRATTRTVRSETVATRPASKQSVRRSALPPSYTTLRQVAERHSIKRVSNVAGSRGRLATTPKQRRLAAQRGAAALPTLGEAFGLNDKADPLSLRSSVALVFDPVSRETLFEKNANVVLPIASITKLMTAVVVIDAGQPLNEMIEIDRDDIDHLRNSGSRLPIGTRLSRGEMLQLALMASENRAASALGRNYPGGSTAFVSAMNAKARMFGMLDTRYSDATGLSGSNVSSAIDLARLVGLASDYPTIRRFSTANEMQVDTGYRHLTFHNTNRLVSVEGWDIGLQKTGYIAEAGRCLVMSAEINGRSLIFVLLDSAGKASRFADASRLRTWLEKRKPQLHAAGAVVAIN